MLSILKKQIERSDSLILGIIQGTSGALVIRLLFYLPTIARVEVESDMTK